MAAQMAAVSTAAALAALFLVCIVVQPVSAIQFKVDRGVRKCLAQEVGMNELVVGSFSSNEGLLDISITSPAGYQVYSMSDSKSGKFAFTGAESGSHELCIVNKGQIQQLVTLTLNVGIAAKDYSGVVRKEHLTPIEAELRRLEDAVTRIRSDMEYLREREYTLRDTNETTNSRVMYFSLFCIITMIVLAILQVKYLQKLFGRLKLIA